MTKLCPRGKAAAKRKFKVYPSAYANAYASKICAGKIKDPSGVKRKDFRGPKPSGAKVGMAVTAGAQSGMGRLEKSGIKKMMGGGFGIFSKKKKDEKKKSTQEENANKKKKRLEELRKEIGAKKGKMMIMIAIGKPKKANKGLHAETKKKKKAIPGDPDERRDYLRNIQNPKSEYDKKGKLRYTFANTGEFIERPIPRKRKKMGIYTKPDYEYQKKKKAYDILTNQDRRPPRPKNLKKFKNGDIIKKVASKLEKASKAHAGQAKTLRSIKVRGGGMAVQGMNFKGVY